MFDNVDRLLDTLEEAGATREILTREIGHSLEELTADEFEDLQEFADDVQRDGKGHAMTMDGQLRGCPATIRIRERRKPTR